MHRLLYMLLRNSRHYVITLINTIQSLFTQNYRKAVFKHCVLIQIRAPDNIMGSASHPKTNCSLTLVISDRICQ